MTTKLEEDGFRPQVTENGIGVGFHQEPREGRGGKGFQLWKCKGYRKQQSRLSSLLHGSRCSGGLWEEATKTPPLAAAISLTWRVMASPDTPASHLSPIPDMLWTMIQKLVQMGESWNDAHDWLGQTSLCVEPVLQSVCNGSPFSLSTSPPRWNSSPPIPSQGRSTNLEPGTVHNPGPSSPKEY